MGSALGFSGSGALATKSASTGPAALDPDRLPRARTRATALRSQGRWRPANDSPARTGAGGGFRLLTKPNARRFECRADVTDGAIETAVADVGPMVSVIADAVDTAARVLTVRFEAGAVVVTMALPSAGSVGSHAIPAGPAGALTAAAIATTIVFGAVWRA